MTVSYTHLDVYKRQTAGPDGIGAQHTVTGYDARTGQTKSYTSSGLFGNHYAGTDGNVYRNSDSGWQQHGAGGWGSAGGDLSLIHI